MELHLESGVEELMGEIVPKRKGTQASFEFQPTPLWNASIIKATHK